MTSGELPELTSGSGTQYRQHPELITGTPGNHYRQVAEVSSGQLGT